MKKIRWWIFLSAVWVAKKVCVYGRTYDYLLEAKKVETSGTIEWWWDGSL